MNIANTITKTLGEHGVTVDYAPLDADRVAVWDRSTKVFTVDQSACEMDQEWALNEMWLHLCLNGLD